MEKFLARYRHLIRSILCGFDRLVFRGSLLALIGKSGMYNFLYRAGVGMLNYEDYVRSTSAQLEHASLAIARDTGR